MWKKLALALIAPASAFASDFPNYYGPITSGSSGGGSSSATAIPATQVPYGTGTGITSDPSMTYSAGILSVFGITTPAGGAVNFGDGVNVTGSSTLKRGVNLLDGATNAGKIYPASSSGGLVFTSNIGNVNATIRTEDSGGNSRGYACYIGLGNSTGCMMSALGFAQPSSTLHVSGTMRITSFTAIGANVTPTTALDVYGTVSATALRLNNQVTASTTQVLYVSASVVDGANGINYDPATDFTAFGATPPLNSFTPSATVHVSGTTIFGICRTNVVCGAPQLGASCFSTVQGRPVYCNGANSWIPAVVTTAVSASAL